MLSKRRHRAIAVLTVLALLPVSARAEGILDQLQVHGLVSQGFLWSTANDYIGHSHRGTFDFTEGALNFTDPLGSSLSVGLQLFADRLGVRGGYGVRFDWFYIDWHRFDWLSLRAGRIKMPFGLYNEQADYEPGRLTILLPPSIYPLTSRDFLLAATGLSARGNVLLGEGGFLSYEAVGGAIFINTSTVAPEGSTVDVPYTYCARVLWHTPLEGLVVGGSVLGTQLNVTTTFDGKPLSGKLPALLWVASVEYRHDRLLLAAEYGQWSTTFHSDQPDVVPSIHRVSERGYVSGQYSLTRKLGVGLYYSVLFPDMHHLTGGRENYQHDVALSLRYDVTPHWLFKLEGHFLRGTAGLDSELNGNRPLSDLTGTWGFVAADVTAYF